MSDASATPSDPSARPADATPTSSEAGEASPGVQPAPVDVPPVVPHAGVRYAVLRLLMLITVGGVLYLIGLRDWLLLLAAFLISAVVSYFAFVRQRNAAAGNLEHQVHDWSERRHAHDAEA